MKFKIIEDKSLKQDEIELRCHTITDEIKELVESLNTKEIRAFKDDREVLIDPSKIIFIETEVDSVYAHTIETRYKLKERLYELEDILPRNFLRISKSAIANTKEISSIATNITSARQVNFHDTNKIVYVSRKYYPLLKEKLNERSL